jgi:hypothetical protein
MSQDPTNYKVLQDEEERVFKRDTAGQGTEGEAVENKVTLAPLYQKQVRKEEAKKQKEEYKKNLEKNCESLSLGSQTRELTAHFCRQPK